jgi:glucosamine 6-phosphate synthetase-like amidotransferase/phosphosugar isomerase protein
MCSIFGIGFYRNHKFGSISTLTGVVSRLFKEAQVSGRRACGLSIMKEKSVHVLRRPKSGSELVGSREYLDFMDNTLEGMTGNDNKLMSIIGHCRAPTQGSPENNLNNHPQVIGNILGVHNGIIGNDHKLFKSFEKVIKRGAEVDTEIIFRLINHFTSYRDSKTIDAIKKTTPYLGGSYACAMQNADQPYNLYLFRHGNPIKVLHYNDMGLVVFATREHFIIDAFEGFVDEAMGKGIPFEVIDDQGVAFNLWDRTLCKFPFQNRTKAQELRHVG